MNLDQELRAALSQEADMQIAPPPDVDVLVMGGQARRQRRTMTRIGLAAAVLVLVGGAAYGVTQDDPGSNGTAPGLADTPSESSVPSGFPTTPPSFEDWDRTPIEPGVYRLLVGWDGGSRIQADLTIEGSGWKTGDYPIVQRDGATGGVGLYQPSSLAAGSGCSGDDPKGGLGTTPWSLARRLATLPKSTVVQPPTPTEAFGHDAVHLRLRIADDCPAPEFYRVAMGPLGERGITYGSVSTPVVIDFWVLDLGGKPIVVDLWHESDAPPQLVDSATRARDSITFVPRP